MSFLEPATWAQDATGKIVGNITHASDAVVPRATVAELHRERVADDSKDDPDAHCLPMGSKSHRQPKTYTKPWTVTVHQHIMVDSELIEFACQENERDAPHLTAK